MMTYIWLAVLIGAIVLEIVTTQIVSVWFAVGALSSLIATLAGVSNVWIQVLIFVVVSAIAVIVTRPLVKKLVNKQA